MIEELIICPTCGHKNPANARYCQNDGTPLRDGDPHDPLVGRLLGEYRLLQRRGEGGFGVVYYAEHVTTQIPYAVKILHPQYSANEQIAERFRREALAAGKLKHDHVVHIAEFGQAPGIGYYYVMEYLEGRTLKSAIDAKEPFPPSRILHIARQVTSAMERVHALKIIHRDLKPENIFLIERNGTKDYVKLVDFGIAKILDDETSNSLTRTGLSVGTPLYMSPEQAKGNLRALDRRTDIYSWGVILFELLTGKPPFYKDRPHDVVMMHIKAKIPKLSVVAPHKKFSPHLEALVRRLLAKKPKDRPDSMLEMYHELETLLLAPDAIIELQPTERKSPFGHTPPQGQQQLGHDFEKKQLTKTPVDSPFDSLQQEVEDTQIASTGERLFDAELLDTAIIEEAEYSFESLDGIDESLIGDDVDEDEGFPTIISMPPPSQNEALTLDPPIDEIERNETNSEKQEIPPSPEDSEQQTHSENEITEKLHPPTEKIEDEKNDLDEEKFPLDASSTTSPSETTQRENDAIKEEDSKKTPSSDEIQEKTKEKPSDTSLKSLIEQEEQQLQEKQSNTTPSSPSEEKKTTPHPQTLSSPSSKENDNAKNEVPPSSSNPPPPQNNYSTYDPAMYLDALSQTSEKSSIRAGDIQLDTSSHFVWEEGLVTDPEALRSSTKIFWFLFTIAAMTITIIAIIVSSSQEKPLSGPTLKLNILQQQHSPKMPQKAHPTQKIHTTKKKNTPPQHSQQRKMKKTTLVAKATPILPSKKRITPPTTSFTLHIQSFPRAKIYIGGRFLKYSPVTLRTTKKNQLVKVKISRRGYYTIIKYWRARNNTHWKIHLRRRIHHKKKKMKKIPQKNTTPKASSSSGDIFQNVDNPFHQSK